MKRPVSKANLAQALAETMPAEGVGYWWRIWLRADRQARRAMESAVIARRSGWWEKQAHLYYVDYEAAKRREQHEPWYVRFAKWTFRDKDDR